MLSPWMVQTTEANLTVFQRMSLLVTFLLILFYMLPFALNIPFLYLYAVCSLGTGSLSGACSFLLFIYLETNTMHRFLT
jgi:hypothetical protein